MVSPDAASRPRNDHRPTMVALLEALELDVDIGDDRIKHVDEQGAPDAGRWRGSLVPVGQAVVTRHVEWARMGRSASGGAGMTGGACGGAVVGARVGTTEWERPARLKFAA